MTNRSLYWMRATTALNFRGSNCEVATRIFIKERDDQINIQKGETGENNNNNKVRLLGGRREKQPGGHQIRKSAAEMRGQQEGTCGRVRLVEGCAGLFMLFISSIRLLGPARLLGTVDPANPIGA